MTANDFRRVALSLPDTSEQAHMGHPDFRAANGKIFATLGYPDAGWGMVKLTPDQQAAFIEEWPSMFSPVKGAWGEGGATSVRLETADESTLREVMKQAWTNVSAARRKPSAQRKAPRTDR